ncbi:metalloprotease [Streptomyces narbonensis]
MTPQTPVFCSIVPPHLLEHLARSSNPAVAAAARRTLIADASARTSRVLPLPGSAPTLAPADVGRPHRTVYDCERGTELPGDAGPRRG